MKLIQCDICGNPHYRVLYLTKDRSFPIDGSFQWVRCPHCGLLYLNPQPEFGELQRHYPAEDYYAYQSGKELGNIVADEKVATLRTVRNEIMKHLGRISSFFQNENEREYSYFGPIHPGMRILDVGCGAGQGLTFYKEHGAVTYGVDISPEACEEGGKRGHHMFCGQLFDAKFENGFFDIVFFKQSLEHMFSPDRILAETHRVLTPNGKVWISLPNHDSTHAKLFGRWFYGIESPRHLFGFTHETLRRLLSQVGFQVEHLHTYYLPGGVCYSLENWLNDHFNRVEPFFYSRIKIKWWYIVAEPIFLFPRIIADLFSKGEILTICASKA
jgi:SAM-dependent methyltransferase